MWFLIIVAVSFNGQTVHVHHVPDFDTKQGCEAAARSVLSSKPRYVELSVNCVDGRFPR
jgi:hypothetical protein